MAEYIEREACCKNCIHYDACRKLFKAAFPEVGDKFDGIINRAIKCPEIKHTADVVEIVRCKDCIYASADGTICRYDVGRDTKPNGYCDRGERRDDDG